MKPVAWYESVPLAAKETYNQARLLVSLPVMLLRGQVPADNLLMKKTLIGLGSNPNVGGVLVVSLEAEIGYGITEALRRNGQRVVGLQRPRGIAGLQHTLCGHEHSFNNVSPSLRGRVQSRERVKRFHAPYSAERGGGSRCNPISPCQRLQGLCGRISPLSHRADDLNPRRPIHLHGFQQGRIGRFSGNPMRESACTKLPGPSGQYRT